MTITVQTPGEPDRVIEDTGDVVRITVGELTMVMSGEAYEAFLGGQPVKQPRRL